MSSRSRADDAAGGSLPSHDVLIREQFSRQAELFARAPELHAEAQLALLIDAARPRPNDISLDVACGPGTVVAAFAARLHQAVGLDATGSMLDQARTLAAARHLANVEWHEGDVNHLPFADGSFDIVTCRFAFHHFEWPVAAFAEMVRVCRSGGHIVLCDGVAPLDHAQAAAFNAMERHRDPSTVAFQALPNLVALFAGAGLPSPDLRHFQVVYEREDLIAKSFPVNEDRAQLRRMIDALIAANAMGTGTKAGDTRFIYPAVVLGAVKPAS